MCVLKGQSISRTQIKRGVEGKKRTQYRLCLFTNKIIMILRGFVKGLQSHAHKRSDQQLKL